MRRHTQARRVFVPTNPLRRYCILSLKTSAERLPPESMMITNNQTDTADAEAGNFNDF